MIPEPIEITPKDIIRRPAVIPGGAALNQRSFNPAKVMADIKSAMKQMQDIINMAKEFGVDLKNIKGLGSLGKLQDMAGKVKELPGPQNQISQVTMFKQFLMMRYGDITVNEVIERLKADLGDKKLSELGKL